VHSETGVRIALVVDDLLVKGKASEVRLFMERIQEKFTCTPPTYLTLDNPIEFVGFKLSMTKEDGQVPSYWMDQEADVDQFLIDHGIDLEGGCGVECPMPTREAMFSDNVHLSEDETTVFKSLVGSLSWFASSLRWDCVQAVSRVQMLMNSPTRGCMSAAMRIAAFIGQTKGFKVGGPRVYGQNQFAFYTDSDFAGDRLMTKASRTGVVLLLNSVPVYWMSRPQPKTVYSPAAAEIYALREGVREGQALMWLLRDLRYPGITFPFLVQVDNSQAISFQEDSCVRTKHRGVVDMAEAWVKELKEGGLVETSHVSGDKNPADIFTKCYTNKPYHARRELMGQKHMG